MKIALAVTIFTNVLICLPAFAAPIKGHDLKSLMSQEVPSKINLTDLAAQMNIVSSKLAQSKYNKAKKSYLTASLGRQITTVINGQDTPVNVIEIGAAIARARDVLDDSKKVGSLDKETKSLHTNLRSAVEVYANGLGVVVGRIEQTDSREAKAIAKILVIGKEIARGQLDVNESKSYVDLMRTMTSILQNPKSSEMSSEQALNQAIDKLDLRKEQKIEEILSRKL